MTNDFKLDPKFDLVLNEQLRSQLKNCGRRGHIQKL